MPPRIKFWRHHCSTASVTLGWQRRWNNQYHQEQTHHSVSFRPIAKAGADGALVLATCSRVEVYKTSAVMWNISADIARIIRPYLLVNCHWSTQISDETENHKPVRPLKAFTYRLLDFSLGSYRYDYRVRLRGQSGSNAWTEVEQLARATAPNSPTESRVLRARPPWRIASNGRCLMTAEITPSKAQVHFPSTDNDYAAYCKTGLKTRTICGWYVLYMSAWCDVTYEWGNEEAPNTLN